MPPPRFTFAIHGERLAIARLPVTAAVPAWAIGQFVTVSRTPTELSIVCPQASVPAAIPHERDRIAIGIQGVVPMSSIGILASLCGALAAAEVPVFAISTFDTDYLLITAERFATARTALAALGHAFAGEVPA